MFTLQKQLITRMFLKYKKKPVNSGSFWHKSLVKFVPANTFSLASDKWNFYEVRIIRLKLD